MNAIQLLQKEPNVSVKRASKLLHCSIEAAKSALSLAGQYLKKPAAERINETAREVAAQECGVDITYVVDPSQEFLSGHVHRIVNKKGKKLSDISEDIFTHAQEIQHHFRSPLKTTNFTENEIDVEIKYVELVGIMTPEISLGSSLGRARAL